MRSFVSYISKIFLCILFIFSANHSFAWGKKGHEIVVQVAAKHLNKGVLDSIQKYLGEMSLEEASDWLDVIKQVHRYDHIRPWHYVNIDKDKTYVETKKPNVINQSIFAITELSNPKNNWTNRNFCLKVILHLLADLHMPLHVGYGEDRGGNDFKLKHNNLETNLHYLWDETIISDFNINTEECLKITSKYSREKTKSIQSGDVLSWANESRSYLSSVYNLKGGKTDKSYMKNAAKITRELLAKAGLRLAHVLNKAFSK